MEPAQGPGAGSEQGESGPVMQPTAHPTGCKPQACSQTSPAWGEPPISPSKAVFLSRLFPSRSPAMSGSPPDTHTSDGDVQSPSTTAHSSQVSTDRHLDRQTWAGHSHSCFSSTEQLEAFGFRPSISSSPVRHEHKRSEPDSQHCQRAGKSLQLSITALPAHAQSPAHPKHSTRYPGSTAIHRGTQHTLQDPWHYLAQKDAGGSKQLWPVPGHSCKPHLAAPGLGKQDGFGGSSRSWERFSQGCLGRGEHGRLRHAAAPRLARKALRQVPAQQIPARSCSSLPVSCTVGWGSCPAPPVTASFLASPPSWAFVLTPWSATTAGRPHPGLPVHHQGVSGRHRGASFLCSRAAGTLQSPALLAASPQALQRGWPACTSLLLHEAPAPSSRRLLGLIRPFVKPWLAAKRNIF